MGTCSTIAVVRADGSVKSVYCHWDGYLSHNGQILLDDYNSQELAEKVTSLGDMSSLGERYDPIGVHSYENAEKGTTILYGRDRGETGVSGNTFKTLEDYNNGNDWMGYDYLFKDGQWTVNGKKLTQQLINKDEDDE